MKSASQRPLTRKQLKFVDAIASGKTGTDAALAAYNTNKVVARTIAAENLAKPSIRDAVQKEMERQGLTLERIIRPVTEALTAEKVIGVAENEREVPDHGTRLKAAGMAAQFLGIGKDNDGSVNVNFVSVRSNETIDFEL